MFHIPRSAGQASNAGIPSPRRSSPRPGMINLFYRRSPGGKFPQSNQEERVCFISFLIRGVESPIHPFQRGLLEYYGLQLHNFTPASIPHIAGFVALCELFLGCEAHFELWRKLFCLIPRTQKGSIFEVGGAEVWRIVKTGYLSGTPKKASEEWPSK